METLDSVVRFFASYPIWARIVVLLCAALAFTTLVVAPREAVSQGGKVVSQASGATSSAKHVFMRVKTIKLFPDDSNVEVQLSVFVNGTEFIHPSIAGVTWMKVGTAMSEKIIELPRSERYDIRFEMRVRDGPTFKPRQRVSQQVTPVQTLPFAESYNLYDLTMNTRAATVSASVAYEIYAQ